MPDQNSIPGDLRVGGNLRVGGLIQPPPPRSQLAQDDLKPYPVNFVDLRVHDAMQTPLPNPAANDDLGFYGGTLGADQPLVRTEDVKTLSKTEYARFLVRLPAEYVAGETVTLRLSAGMITTVADTSCTLDVQAFKTDREGSVGADLYAGAALDINSLVFADKDFNLTATGLSPGDVLDVRIAVAVVDAATATAVIAALGAIDLLCDVKG